jgi:hypothetical protein
MPGDSGQDLHVVEIASSGIQFRVTDSKKTAAALAGLGFHAKSSPEAVTVADPDGDLISFVK